MLEVERHEDLKEMNTWGEGGAPHAKRAKYSTSFDRVVVHHPNKVAIEISTRVEGTVLSWAQLARHFVEKSLLHPPQLFHLLASLSPHKHTRYLFRYADGYASVINAEWASKSGITANDNSRETGLTIEVNISLKPRDSIGEVMAAAWQRWSSAMEHKAIRGGRESFDVVKEEDGVVHVDLVVEKLVVVAEDQIAFGGGGGGGGETCGDGGFRFTTTQLPYPIDDRRTNVLYIKEHPLFSRVVDKFCVKRLEEKASENDDTLIGRTKSKKDASLFLKKTTTKTLATNDDDGSAQGSGKEVKMPTPDDSKISIPNREVNGSSDAIDLPVGWKIHVVPRMSDDPKTKYDTYWFSPQKSYKFDSKRRADRFCAFVEKEGGDEAAAHELYKMAQSRKPGKMPKNHCSAGLRIYAKLNAIVFDSVKDEFRPPPPPPLPPTLTPEEETQSRLEELAEISRAGLEVEEEMLYVDLNQVKVESMRVGEGDVAENAITSDAKSEEEKDLSEKIPIQETPVQLPKSDDFALSGCSNENNESDYERPQRKVTSIQCSGDQKCYRIRPKEQVVQSKSVLCNCYCGKRNLSVQGMYAHYGRAHTGKLSWNDVTFSCPFCPFNVVAAPFVFKSFPEVEAHVNMTHPGVKVAGPHLSKPSRESISAQKSSSESIPAQKSSIMLFDRILRERKEAHHSSDSVTKNGKHTVPKVVAKEQGPSSWSKIGYVRLLSDGKKQFPRDLCKVIKTVEDQCHAQEEIVEVARKQRMNLVRNEAEIENKAMDEERLVFQRGIRERARLADGERIEKQKYIEKAEQMMMLNRYENRNKGRHKEAIEVEKLCARSIYFSSGMQRPNTRHGNSCDDDQCLFCNKAKGFFHHLLLDNEIKRFKMNAPATESSLYQHSINVPNPSFHVIDDSFYSKAEGTSHGIKDDGKEATGGSKRSNQNRRDESTAKRVKMEEDKLLTLKNIKHCLEFIKKYNEGMIINAWGEPRKDSRGRRSLY